MNSQSKRGQFDISVEIGEIPTIYFPPTMRVIVRSRVGKVYLGIGAKVIELTTITAHGIGMAIMKAQLDFNELIVLEINRERFEFLHPIAKKIAIGLLRKADDADDWQLTHKRITA